MEDLRVRRLEAGLTQAELARRSGVAQPNIAAYESGRRRASATMSARLEAALRPLPRHVARERRQQILQTLAAHRMTNPRVFGSAAAGRDTPGSDLDLLVDAGPDLDLLDLIDAGDELEELLGLHVDLVTSRSLRPGHEIARTAVPL